MGVHRDRETEMLLSEELMSKYLSVTAWSAFGFISFQGGSFQIVKSDSQNILLIKHSAPNCEERAYSLFIEYHFRI